mmetsp:Transcript_34234/g.94357  ORF Transcript_34234/g.94357 Transcript_34234/m.94357 type:complete len:205 (+) Transcript_34234:165-779(+)
MMLVSMCSLSSRIIQTQSIVFALPCRRMQLVRNSGKSISPLLFVSSMSNRILASETSTSMESKNSFTSWKDILSSISSKVMTPVWSASRARKRRVAFRTCSRSFSMHERSIACCTKVALTTFITEMTVNAIQKKNTTPIKGEIWSISGATRSSQSTPPVRPWNRDSIARGTEPYHCTSSAEGLWPPARIGESSWTRWTRTICAM